jgi:hypothetical protein
MVNVDSNSLPMPVDLDVFPPLVRWLFIACVVASVGFFLLLVVIGLLGA